MYSTNLQENRVDEPINLIHLDKLNITLKHHASSPFLNSPNLFDVIEHQAYNKIELRLNDKAGGKMYYHCFDVYYLGIKIGKLLTASKFKKPEIEFELDKSILYSNYGHWWYDLTNIVIDELGLSFNNINYVEIALDTTLNLLLRFSGYYLNSERYMYSINPLYKQSKRTTTNMFNNGSNFEVQGNNSVSIYKKTAYAEDYIVDFFRANGFGDQDVYRCESKLNYNYLKSYMRNKKVKVDLSTLKDIQMLTTIFAESTKSKLSFNELSTKYFDTNGNPKYANKIYLLQDISFSKSVLPTCLPIKQSKHYKNDNADEEIFKRAYYKYIETGKMSYLDAMKLIIEDSRINNADVINMKNKFDRTYAGDRLKERQDRIAYAEHWFSVLGWKCIDDDILINIWKKLNELDISGKQDKICYHGCLAH